MTCFQTDREEGLCCLRPVWDRRGHAAAVHHGQRGPHAAPAALASRPRPPASRGRWQTGEAWLHGRARRQSQGRLRAGCRRSPCPRCRMRGGGHRPVECHSGRDLRGRAAQCLHFSDRKTETPEMAGAAPGQGETARFSIWVFGFFVLRSLCTCHRPC